MSDQIEPDIIIYIYNIYTPDTIHPNRIFCVISELMSDANPQINTHIYIFDCGNEPGVE